MKLKLLIFIIFYLFACDSIDAQTKPKRDEAKDKSAIIVSGKIVSKTKTVQKKTHKSKRISNPQRRIVHSNKFRKSTSTPTYLLVNESTSLSKTFGTNGGFETFMVNTDSEDWFVELLPPWCKIVKYPSSFTLRYDDNTSEDDRSDWFFVRNGYQQVRIDVKQRGKPKKVTGNIQYIWVSHDVSDSHGNKGMDIHVQFKINGMLRSTGQVVAYFYNSNGMALRDTNYKYNTSDGCVAASVDVDPNCSNRYVNDLTIFMPYDEMHLSESAACFFVVYLWNGNDVIAISEPQPFQIKIKSKRKHRIKGY